MPIAPPTIVHELARLVDPPIGTINFDGGRNPEL
jgi:hypothetical protein